MKKMFKYTTITLIILSLFIVTGCEKKTTKTNKIKVKTEEKTKGNCKIFDCLTKVNDKSTLEDVNKEIGFEGEKTNEGEGWTTYKWSLNDDEKVEATFYSTSTTVKISFKDEKIKNKKVDFSKYEEVSKALKNKETLTYDDIKSKFGGVDGTLTEISSTGVKYKWVNSEGGYLNVSFNKDKSKCTMVIGRI